MKQVPSLILPTVWELGTETETVADIVEHTSIEFSVEYLHEKQINIIATEVGAVAGNLLCWVELSPYPTANSDMWLIPLPVTAIYWAAIGGGGGALPPTAPLPEAGVAAGAMHPILIPWTTHSVWARLVVQTPVLGLGVWVLQAFISGKNP